VVTLEMVPDVIVAVSDDLETLSTRRISSRSWALLTCAIIVDFLNLLLWLWEPSLVPVGLVLG